MNEPQQFLRRKDICRVYGISETTLNRMRKSGRLPEPVRVTERIVAWRADELDAALKSPPKAA